MISRSRRAGSACLAVLLLVLPLVAFTQPAGGSKPPIFILPGWVVSSLTGQFDPPPGVANTTATAVLNDSQFEELLLQTAGNGSSKLNSIFFSVEDSNSSSNNASIAGARASSLGDSSSSGGSLAGSSRSSGPTSAEVDPAGAAADTTAPSASSQQATELGSQLQQAAQQQSVSAGVPAGPGGSLAAATGTAALRSNAAGAVAAQPALDAATAAAAAAIASGCPLVPFANVSTWLPSAPLASLGTKCWKSLLQLTYSDNARAVTKPTFVNNTNVHVVVRRPGASAMRYPLFSLAGYNRLVEFIESQFNYTRGTDLFALPYDFRLDCDSMATSGQLQLLAQEVLRRVERSGQRAVLIGHSYGATVGLQLLQEPSLKGKVQGFVALGPMFGGSVATLAARASGLFDYVLPWLTEELTAVLAGADNVRQHMYSVTQGMPSVVQMMPHAEAFGPQTVAVTVTSTNKTYRVGELSNFLKDIGEPLLASSYSQVHAAASLLKAGPAPGVQTFCIYGASSDTPLSLKYEKPLLAGQPNDMPSVDSMGKGDGVVNLESLRLCRSIASSPGHVSELSGVTHYSVYSKRTALKAIKKALTGLLT